jgi:hypothetical protein
VTPAVVYERSAKLTETDVKAVDSPRQTLTEELPRAGIPAGPALG